jgi:hypothetical protein
VRDEVDALSAVESPLELLQRVRTVAVEVEDAIADFVAQQRVDVAGGGVVGLGRAGPVLEDDDRAVATERREGPAENLLLGPLDVDLDHRGAVARIEYVIEDLQPHFDVLHVRLIAGRQRAKAQAAPALRGAAYMGELRDAGMVGQCGLTDVHGRILVLEEIAKVGDRLEGEMMATGCDTHHFRQDRAAVSADVDAIVVRAQHERQQTPHLLKIALVSLRGLLHSVDRRTGSRACMRHGRGRHRLALRQRGDRSMGSPTSPHGAESDAHRAGLCRAIAQGRRLYHAPAVQIEIFDDRVWQMSLGERAAVEGVLSQLKPALAIEIGSMEGACLRRIAAHAQEVHSFDLAPPSLPMPDNVTLHTGDSHELLPAFLADLADEGRNVDFVMVDGDHTSEGVRKDLVDLLDSRALGRSIILIHDTANEQVRRGVDEVRFMAWPKVAHVELDWIAGHVFAEPALRNELWYGLGLVLVDVTRLAYADGPVYEQRYHPTAQLLAEARELIIARERLASVAPGSEDDLISLRRRLSEVVVALDASLEREAALHMEVGTLRARSERDSQTLQNLVSSPSWRVTAPLRAAKRQAARRARVR